jgi:hypothetical protein
VGARRRSFTEISQQFKTCGVAYGSPPIGVRYLPVIRMDIAGMTYSSAAPGPLLSAGDVSAADVAQGRFQKTRYATYAGACLLNGYVMRFLLTVSGTYRVWVFTDTKGYRSVPISKSTLTVLPRPAVLANYRGLGGGLTCATDTDCMANVQTSFVVQAMDMYMNPATSCAEALAVQVVPSLTGADHFVVRNLVEQRNVGGVPVNGVPGPGVDINTLSGLVGVSIQPFAGAVGACAAGAYAVSFLATLSARYAIRVAVNGSALFGSPFSINIVDQVLPLTPGRPVNGLVTQTRFTYYRAYFDVSGVGFMVAVSKTDTGVNQGQPWTYLRYREQWGDLQEPASGVRYAYPDARSAQYCQVCRIHVPPGAGRIGFWYIAVHGFQDNSYFTVTLTPSADRVLLPTVQNSQYATLDAGSYAYFRFTITSTSGFQVRAAILDSSGGSMTATLKKGAYPDSERDAGSVLGVSLRAADCTECIVDFPPSDEGPGAWYFSVLAITQPASFQVILIEHEAKLVSFGKSYAEYTQLSYSWGYYTFVLDPYTDPDAFQVQVVPLSAQYNITTVLKQSQAPVSLADSTFRTQQCTHCRITVMTRRSLQSAWHIGVYTGASGGTFRLRVRLFQSCPNNCFGNGECRQHKVRACVCFPGYTGLDCGLAVKAKVFAWFPLDWDALDVSGNLVPLFYKLNRGGRLLFQDGAFSLFDSYVVVPKPTPAVACAPFLGPTQTDPKNYQWGGEVRVEAGSAARNRVSRAVPEVPEWYRWNEIGDKVCARARARASGQRLGNLPVKAGEKDFGAVWVGSCDGIGEMRG